MEPILQTSRLLLREMTEDDLPALRSILQDPQVMYAYEHAFSEEEVRAWLAKQRRRYAEDGFGLWAMVLRQTGAMIGQCGLTWQDRGDGTQCVEVGYLLQRAFWHHHPGQQSGLSGRGQAQWHDRDRAAGQALLRHGYAPSGLFCPAGRLTGPDGRGRIELHLVRWCVDVGLIGFTPIASR